MTEEKIAKGVEAHGYLFDKATLDGASRSEMVDDLLLRERKRAMMFRLLLWISTGFMTVVAFIGSYWGVIWSYLERWILP